MQQRKSRNARRAAKQMHANLVKPGFDWSCERVAALCSGMEGRPAARAPDCRSRNRSAAGVPTGRGVPVRLASSIGRFDWPTRSASSIGRFDRPTRSANAAGCCGPGLCRGPAHQVCRVARMSLQHSRAARIRACWPQTHATPFDAHWHGFGRGILEPVADCH